MTEKEKMIPLSVIDAHIRFFKSIAKYDPLQEPVQQYLKNIVIPTLERIRKEAR